MDIVKDLKIYKPWLKNLTCRLSEWLWNLIPENINQREFLTAAAICGATRKDLKWGQVSFEIDNSRCTYLKMPSLVAAKLLVEFGDYMYMTSPASILRTAIMAGLPLPRIHLGVMSQTRYSFFNKDEIQDIFNKAQVILDDRRKRERTTT
jgi:hypothetical protein